LKLFAAEALPAFYVPQDFRGFESAFGCGNFFSPSYVYACTTVGASFRFLFFCSQEQAAASVAYND
jgi:hypothetical protein